MSGSEVDLGAVFDEHMAAEFQDHDADVTMTTMTASPFLTHVPVITGGYGWEAVHTFYRDHFVTKWPADTVAEEVSRTVSEDVVVLEVIMRFTHDIVMDAILPGVPPTGRHVEAPFVAVVGFEGSKIAFERIYWDQASILAQIGLLDPARYPVVGADQARVVLDPSRPRNELIRRAAGSA